MTTSMCLPKEKISNNDDGIEAGLGPFRTRASLDGALKERAIRGVLVSGDLS
jgi:hypothetical protein